MLVKKSWLRFVFWLHMEHFEVYSRELYIYTIKRQQGKVYID